MKITHDLHTHTLHSSCCYDPEATISGFIDKAAELSHNIIGISNHVWDETVPGSSQWYRGQTINYVLEGKYAIPENTHGIKVLFGCESEYCGMSDTLGMTAENGKKFDYVLIPHTHTHMKNFVIAENDDVKRRRKEIATELCKIDGITEAAAKKMANTYAYKDLLPSKEEATVNEAQYIADFCFNSFEALMKNPEFIKLAAATPTFIAHPFQPCGLPSVNETYDVQRLLDPDRLYADFETAARLNVGLDVNLSTYANWNDPENDLMIRIMRIAKKAGCKFIFGTDAHSIKELEKTYHAEAVANGIGLTEEDLADIVKL